MTLNLRTHACTTGIEAMRARHPEATTCDELIYLEGWNRAERWALYTTGSVGRARVQAYYAITDADQALEECEGIISKVFDQIPTHAPSSDEGAAA